jgi:hypothetical protein
LKPSDKVASAGVSAGMRAWLLKFMMVHSMQPRMGLSKASITMWNSKIDSRALLSQLEAAVFFKMMRNADSVHSRKPTRSRCVICLLFGGLRSWFAQLQVASQI